MKHVWETGKFHTKYGKNTHPSQRFKYISLLYYMFRFMYRAEIRQKLYQHLICKIVYFKYV
jgi:hypothetical protein